MPQLLLDYVWSSEECDTELRRNGVCINVIDMPSSKCFDVIKSLSHQSGIKFDFYNMAGRKVIICHANDANRAFEFINKV